MATTRDNLLKPDHWVKNYGDMLYNYTMARVSKPEIAEDLVQDSLLAAYKSREAFKGQSAEKTWLFSILKRKIIDYYRSAEYRFSKVSFEEFHRSFDSPFEEDGNTQGQWKNDRSPTDWQVEDDQHTKTEFLQMLQKCIENLPQRTAAVFVLKNIEDVASEEICKDMGISPSNLWVILHRARLQLRECLEKVGFTR